MYVISFPHTMVHRNQYRILDLPSTTFATTPDQSKAWCRISNNPTMMHNQLVRGLATRHHAGGPTIRLSPSKWHCDHFHKFFSTNNGSITKLVHKHEHKAKEGSHLKWVAAVLAVVGASSSLYTRHIRNDKLSTLTLAKDSEIFHTKYNLNSLIETVSRAGLIGTTKSVKDEIHTLRQWHTERGYNGGIVVRDLSRPLFSLREHPDEHDENSNLTGHEINMNIDHMNRRECYYLYYEIHSNGETRQQLFCRGTTLLMDVLTCLQWWFVYDEELGCRVHYGFNSHADRIVEDVLPLLAPPRGNTCATVEVCGHSLGGAVAMLVAIKLRKRGYAVTRVTSLAGPRFCWVSKH